MISRTLSLRVVTEYENFSPRLLFKCTQNIFLGISFPLVLMTLVVEVLAVRFRMFCSLNYSGNFKVIAEKPRKIRFTLSLLKRCKAESNCAHKTPSND